MLNCKFRVTYIDVTTSRRVSFAQSVGIVDTPYGISYLALALSIMRQHPSDYPCPCVSIYTGNDVHKSDCPLTLV
nr:MAG TPA: hypothetical protein [Microviridae sp.]